MKKKHRIQQNHATTRQQHRQHEGSSAAVFGRKHKRTLKNHDPPELGHGAVHGALQDDEGTQQSIQEAVADVLDEIAVVVEAHAVVDVEAVVVVPQHALLAAAAHTHTHKVRTRTINSKKTTTG